jgi:1-acyl-sn-glycerol-3-phosphate acyltransferase
MIARIRAVVAFLIIASTAVVLALPQYLIVKSGIGSPAVIPQLWHRIVVWALGIRITVHGTIAADRPLMLASNHISWTDILVISSVAKVCFIAKSQLGGWPIFGTLARLHRTVFVDRERRRKSGEQASELAERLTAGDVMVLFAEGSTSDGNLLLPFKSTLFGAAEIAVRERAAETVHIQPVAITYTRLHGMPMGRQRRRTLAAWIGDTDLIPHFRALLREGAIDVEVEFGEPVEFSTGSDRKLVTRRIEGEVRRMMSTMLRDARRPERLRAR